jgi:dTMP kinase
MAAEQAAAREAAEIERQRAEAEERRRLAEAEERERRLAQERQAAEAEARAEAQRLAREQAERAERERRAAMAAARAERQEKMDRIAALEQQIADIQAEIDSDSEQALIMQQAIAAAEELLRALTADVAKYELTDESGNTLEPLSKDLIAELEARKDELVDRARGL